MYDTPGGVRVLLGPERLLFTESLAMMVDFLSDEDIDFGVTVFDRLQRNQKIAVLYEVGRALLMESEPAPQLTAVIEATVASVYRHAHDMVFQEIESGSDGHASTLPTWRELVLAAVRNSDVMERLPHPGSTNKEAWDFLIVCLEGQVLWDDDWEIEEQLDVPPESSRRWKQKLGIPDDYYTAVAPDPSDAEAEIMLEKLRQLTSQSR